MKMRLSTITLAAPACLLLAGCISHHEKHLAYIPGPEPPVVVAPAPPAPPLPDVSLQGPTEADRILAVEVRRNLLRGPLAPLSPDIGVYARNGTVILAGTVPTEDDRQMLLTAVCNSTGVAAVSDQLLVASSPTGSSVPRVYPQPPPKIAPPPATAPSAPTSDAFNLQVQGLNETDRVLGQRILGNLKSDAALAPLAPEVNIVVVNGKVVLRGNVQSDAQKRSIEAAVQNAAGIGNVDNQLRVTNP